jgi:hypothetical protein
MGLGVAARRLLGVHASQWAQHAAVASSAAPANEAERGAEHIPRVPPPAAASRDDAGRGQGRRGRQPRRWRYRSRLVVPPEAVGPPDEAHGGTVLATPLRSAVCTAVERLQADQEPHSTVAPGVRGIKNPAAISPGWREKPERMAAVARRTVVGLLV